MKTKKIIKVLEFIEEVCKRYPAGNCCDCPFSDETGSCMISTEHKEVGLTLPEDWSIDVIKRNLSCKERIK